MTPLRDRLAPLLAGLMLCSAALAADPPAGAKDEVLAKVDDRLITRADIQQILTQLPGADAIAPAALPIFQAQALEQFIQRQLVMRLLDQEKVEATPEEIDAAIQNFERQIGQQAGGNLDETLAQRGLDRAALRAQLNWDIRWKKYVAARLTDDALAKYFDAHHRDFDGTQLRVSHILLRPSGLKNAAALQQLAQRAAQIRAEIAAGRLSFVAAATNFSAGPSREQGGDLGYISRHEPMAEPFSRAAFALEKGDVSEPVLTNFGVHLILCADVRPGTKTWREVGASLNQAAEQALFVELAAAQRPKSAIQYTGAIPHLDPTTGQLVP